MKLTTWISRGLAVAGSRLLWIHTSRVAWSLYKCAVLWRAVYGSSGPIHEHSGYGFLSHHDLSR